MKRFNKGVTMVELLLVLSIIAVVLVLASRYYYTANLSREVNESYKQIQTIAAAGQSWWDDHNHDFTGITSTQVLIDNGYLTSEYKKNTWGGNVSVVGSSASELSITFASIPNAACNNLFNKLGVNQTCSSAGSTDLTVCVDASKQFATCQTK